MIPQVKREVKRLIKEYNLNCSIKEFKNKVDWDYISIYQRLSEPFIREFADKVDWYCISQYQTLSDSLLSYILKNHKEEDIIQALYVNKNLSQAKKNMIKVLTGVKYR